ncbi:MAG TPA: PAS domain-containing sensor histidine kinase [Gammaproteobacteria bacterium]|nr:PAS domain-containing sensor histidine kinase [Gammaproteobacteria bacterium]
MTDPANNDSCKSRVKVLEETLTRCRSDLEKLLQVPDEKEALPPSESDTKGAGADLAQIYERRWRVLFDSGSAWINICDSNCAIIEVNQAGIDIMEADSAADMIGKRLPDFVYGGREEEVTRCEAILQEARGSRRQIELCTFKGNRRLLEVMLVRFPDKEQGEQRFFSILTDQTEERLAQEQLIQRQKELARVMRTNTLGEMASGMAHELNQPLAAIQSYIEGCQNRIANSSCDKSDFLYVLERMSGQINRAVGTLSEVRYFFRKDDSRMACENINEIIYNAVNLWKTLSLSRDIEFQLQVQDDIPAVLANSVQIEQVLLNLVRNAEEAFEDSGDAGIIPVIRITTQQIDETMVKINVKDNGPGLPQVSELDIWNQFITTKKEGMGMGLPICRSIIEAHNGQLTAMDNEQGGAEFSFTLPIYRPEVNV